MKPLLLSLGLSAFTAMAASLAQGELAQPGWFLRPPTNLTDHGRWEHRDIGEVRVPGAAIRSVWLPNVQGAPGRWEHRALDDSAFRQTAPSNAAGVTLTASGWGHWPSSDGIHLCAMTLPGDGEIIARPASWHESNGVMRAGITLRTGWGDRAPHVSLQLHSTGGVTFIARGSNTIYHSTSASETPWLRLRRTGSKVTAAWSDEGRKWIAIEQAPLETNAPVLAGVFAATTINSFLSSVSFAPITITSGTTLSADEIPAPSLVFRDRSVLAGQVKVGAGHVRLTRDGRTRTNDLRHVAAVVFSPVAIEEVFRNPVITGAILNNGDRFEGVIDGTTEWDFHVKSMLLGRQRFGWDERPAALVFGGGVKSRDRWLVRLADGSVLHVPEVRREGGNFTMQHEWLGALQFPASEVVQIRRP